MKQIYSRDKSIVPACDFPIGTFEKILQQTGDIEKVGAYKVGFYLMLDQGLPQLCIPEHTLYNHRSGSCDIPDVGSKFMDVLLKNNNIEGIILTPMTGPETMERWMEAADQKGLSIYLEPFLDTSFLQSQNGYLADNTVEKILDIGINYSVNGFIFPNNDDGRYISSHIDKDDFDVIIRDGDRIDDHVYELTAYDVMTPGLTKVMELARKYTDKPIIYDHQKAGTDLPQNAKLFAESAKASGVDAVILFPLAGPDSEKAFITESANLDLGVMVGGYMTHPRFVCSEGGFVDDKSTEEIYLNAAVEGVQNYIVPGNKPSIIGKIKKLLEDEGVTPIFSAPGFVKQGDVTISESGKAAGKYMHGIVGRGIYGAEDPRQAAIDLSKDL